MLNEPLDNCLSYSLRAIAHAQASARVRDIMVNCSAGDTKCMADLCRRFAARDHFQTFKLSGCKFCCGAHATKAPRAITQATA